MPFTLAHPAAALPLRNRLGRLGSGSALAVGALAPDLAYFVPLGVSGSQSHSWAGLLWFCLPAGVLAWVINRLLLRPFALALAPAEIARRAGPGRAIEWSSAIWLAATVSVVVGATTHVLWDSFTHSSGAAVQAIPALRLTVHVVDAYEPALFTLLQHASGLAGLSLLAGWGARWYWRTEPRQALETAPLSEWAKGTILLTLGLIPAVVGLSVVWPLPAAREDAFHMLRQAIGRAVFSAGAVFLPMLVSAALGWRGWRSLRK